MLKSNVRKIMEGKKLRIRQLVEMTGLSDKTILRARGSQITQCRLNTLLVLAKHLDCKVKDLFHES